LNSHRRYLRTSLGLALPPLAISFGLWAKLPWPYVDDAFWSDVPRYISVPENVLRIAAFALAALLPFGVDTPRQQRGLLVYLVGLCLYAASYGAQILFPEAAWSQTAIGLLAPAWTPELSAQKIALPVQHAVLLNCTHHKLPFHGAG
jgi:hypothetical protein